MAKLYTTETYSGKIQNTDRKKVYDIKEKLELNMHALNSLGAYYYGSDTIKRDEFQKYTSTVMKMHPYIYSLQWLPKVPYALKEQFEQDAQREGYEDFFIYEFDADGKKHRVSERENYYPVFYAEPFEQNKIALGLDVGYEHKRNETLVQSAKTLSIAMSTPINLIEGGSGILMFCPIYKDMQTKHDLSGFFIAVVKIEELIKKAIEDEFFNKAIASFSVRDTQLPQNEGLLFSYECCNSISNIYHESTINFASRNWSVKAHASNYFANAQFTKKFPFILLTLLLGITSLAAFATFMMLKRHETLVDANEEMRRFQNIAITREERIAELKKIIQEQNKANEATHG